MTPREELIRQAAVILTNYLDDAREPDKRHNGQYDETDWGQAQAIIEAILPQVTTVEELEALNRDALVTSATQSGVIPVPVWRIFAGLGWDGEPLTVVWQP